MQGNDDHRTARRPPLAWHGWALVGLFLAYGLGACWDHAMSLLRGADYYRASGMDAAQVAYFSSLPTWAVAGWTLSVWGCLLGAVALLLGQRHAALLFAASLLGSLLYILQVLVLSDGREAMGVLWPAPVVLAVLIAGMALYARRLARAAPR